MPIGYDSGEFGRTSNRDNGLSETGKRPGDYDSGSSPDLVLVSRSKLTVTIWETFVTQHDERVCPVCGPYDGASWPQDEGLFPPLHANCRCYRVVSFVTYESREG